MVGVSGLALWSAGPVEEEVAMSVTNRQNFTLLPEQLELRRWVRCELLTVEKFLFLSYIFLAVPASNRICWEWKRR